MPARFAHLHLHSEYSLVDSTVRIKELVSACAARGLPAVAITDQNNLFSLVKFYRAAEGAGIKPIAGADVLVADGTAAASRLTLLCRDREGYLRLSQLLTQAWMEGHRHDGVVIRPQWLRDGTDGLFAIAGPGSEPGQLLAANRPELATQALRDLQASFGERLHLELLRTGRAGEDAFNGFALDASQALGLPVVASNDVRFIDAEGFDAHEARVCIASGRVLDDSRRPRDYSAGQYLKSADEMAALFADIPDALDNAVALATRCNLELQLGTYYLPAFPVPDDETLDSWIRGQARAGLEGRLAKASLAPGKSRQDYDDRLEVELDVIVKMGFPGYFLIVADFINWAKEHGIPVGPGRGSGAGSLVAWALGITDLDPLPYDLLFERFLNPERVSMPDFDIDFCMDRRDEVIDYVARKYGRDRVSQIITYGTMAAKAVVRDSGRVLGFPYGFVDGVAKLVPMTLGIGLDDALGRTEKSRSDDAWRSDELIQRYGSEDDVRDLLDLALELEDLTRNAGKHAGGVVIAPSPLSDFCPLFAEHDGQGHGRNPVTQFDKDDVEAVGLVKFDFLGLRNLTIIQTAVEFIDARHPELKLDLATLEFTDPAAYRLLADANTTAIFQVEGEGMKKLLKKLQPDRFEDIIAVLALYRPGPLNSGMVDDFILRKKGQQKIDYFHPDLTATLEPTYGVIVYQEQVMQISQIVGGYTLGGADLLRRAMGKKKPEEMAQHRGLFVEGAKNKGYDEALADKLFDLMAMFAEYGFNKSHTAAYAVVTYHTAWLKAKYPAEFIAATLSSDMGDTDKVQILVADARQNKVDVLGPDVNASAYRFEPVDDARGGRAIRYGLGGVKGTGEGAVANVLKARADGPFRDLFDFCARVDRKVVNRRTIEALVRAGAFDSLNPDRALLLANVGRAIDTADAADASVGQESLFGGSDGAIAAPVEWLRTAAWTERQRLQEEKSALGFYLSGHLFHGFSREVRRFVKTTIGDLQPTQQPVWIAGIVASQRMQMTRRGKMLVVVLDDDTGAIEIPLFNELYEKHRATVREDELLVLQVAVRDDRNGGQRLIVEKLLDLTAARREFGKRVVIGLNGNADGSLLRAAITPWLSPAEQQEPDGLPVVVEYSTSDARCAVQLGERWRVRPADDLLASLRRLAPQRLSVEY